jgi:hypothetical protein
MRSLVVKELAWAAVAPGIPEVDAVEDVAEEACMSPAESGTKSLLAFACRAKVPLAVTLGFGGTVWEVEVNCAG